MLIQPILTDTVLAFGEMKMFASMNNSYHELGAKKESGAHIHGCHEIYVNFSGDVSFFHGSTTYTIRPLDVIVSHPGDVHYCIYHSSCQHAHCCIWLKSDEVGNYLERRGIRGKIEPSPSDRERLPLLLQKLSDPEIDPFLRGAAVMELLSALDTEVKMMAKKAQELPAVMNGMLDYIDQHLTTVSGSTELAQAFFISKATVNRMFKKYVGISALKLIEAKRLSYAESLLRRDLSVTDACYQSGFSDCSRFISDFRKKFGQTPLKYKQELFRKG